MIHCDPQLLFEHMDPGSVRAQFSALMAQTALSSLHEPWQRREWLRHTATVWGETWLVETLDALEEESAQPLQPRLLEFRWGTAEQYSYSPEDISHATLTHCSGRWLAVLGDEQGVEVWDARLSIFLRRFPQFAADCLLTALYSGNGPDGPLIAAGTSDGQVFVWDLNSQVLHTHIQTDGYAITAVAIGHLREVSVVAERSRSTTCPGTGWHPWMCSPAGCVAWRQMTAWTTCGSRSSTSRDTTAQPWLPAISTGHRPSSLVRSMGHFTCGTWMAVATAPSPAGLNQ
jgi:WD40 repeat protein